MVHNGIEYGDMQLIAEAYHLMKSGLGMSCDEMADTFDTWNKGELDSFLIEITAQILRHKDTDGSPLLEKIRDAAGQKGTGKWTAIESLEQGMPVTLIGEAVFARCLSALQDQRIAASTRLAGPNGAKFTGDRAAFLDSIRQALFASKVVSYAQGFMLMAEAAKQYGWKLNYGEISLMWRGGCIIRSVFLAKIKEAYDTDPGLPNLLLAPYFTEALAKCQDGWRQVVAQSAMLGVPIPALSTALAFYDGYRCARGPANLLQAQRDYFGAHTFERLEKRGKWEHANWTGTTGRVTAATYDA
jgi:6-phosphogluconate dehydrogenase